MSRTYVGIDNGVTGAVGVISDSIAIWFQMPVRKELNYTKKKAFISRVDRLKLKDYLRDCAAQDVMAHIERPMVNPGRFMATLSAMRALEATLGVLEDLGIPYQYVDSKEWQKAMLPSGLKGDELKKASLEVGRRLWPHIDFKPDADAMLIAEALRRKGF